MLQAHRRLGDFEIVRLLGRGGMGEVYEAQQLNPPRRVALKVLAPWLVEDEETLQRFWREAAVPAQLDHPSIVRIISTGRTDDGLAFYTMQLVRGLSLAQLIERAAAPEPLTEAQPTVSEAVPPHDTPSAGRPATPDATPPVDGPAPPVLRRYVQDRFAVVARLGAQAARALASAHRHDVLHRDIKPSNLMVDHHDHLYLVDFGLTRALEPDGIVTQPGAVRGTPWYMSPEQAEGEVIDQRSDIYSLGVTLYELASLGVGPFTASRQNRSAVLAQVRTGQWLPLRTLAPDVPPALERVIQRAMHYNPARRYQDAEEFADDLERAAANLEGTPAPRPARRPANWRRRLRLALAVGLGVAALVLLAVFLPRGARQGGELEKSADESAVFPEILRTRDTDDPFQLFRRDGQPVWSRRLAGTGKFQTLPSVPPLLALLSPLEDPWCTALAVADVPGCRRYEFSVELKQMFDPKTPPPPDQCRAGVFWGWRPGRDPWTGYRCLAVEVDVRPGQATVGTCRFDPGDGVRGPAVEPLRPLAGGRGVLPLPKEEPRDGHRVRIRVVGSKVTVSVGWTAPLEFDLDRLGGKDGRAAAPLELDGALGIWASKGPAWFRNATFTRLAADARGD